eukprot:TRINITY_DN4172_c0_g1_i2.p1 TRINITY_DN4172_c0_g1~~TRINITY_DN4172_c0_g1_i2.p1  ORF type:complete len:1041 (+),score=276.03 TRINITY_DN4172_c0_g1_i2:343-3465(+)
MTPAKSEMRGIITLFLIGWALATRSIETSGEGLLGAFTQNMTDGQLQVYISGLDQWEPYLSYFPQYPQQFVLVTTHEQDPQLSFDEWLIIGNSVENGNPIGFTIYNRRTNTISAHPFYQATGLIMDATHVGNGNYLIAGNLGGNALYPNQLGILALCTWGSGCSPTIPLANQPAFPPGSLFYASLYNLCQTTVLASIQTMTEFGKQLWEWDPIVQGWNQVIPYYPPLDLLNPNSLEFVCVNNISYALVIGGYSDQYLNDSALCLNTLASSHLGQYVIVRIASDSRYTCDKIVTGGRNETIHLGQSDSHFVYATTIDGTIAIGDWTIVIQDMHHRHIANMSYSGRWIEDLYYYGDVAWISESWVGFIWYGNNTWTNWADPGELIFQVENSTWIIGNVPDTITAVVSLFNPEMSGQNYTMELYGPVLPVLPLTNDSYILANGYNISIGAYYGIVMTEFLGSSQGSQLTGVTTPPWIYAAFGTFMSNDTVVALFSEFSGTFYSQDGEQWDFYFPSDMTSDMFVGYFYTEVGWTAAMAVDDYYSFCSWNMSSVNMSCWESPCLVTDILSDFNGLSSIFNSPMQVSPNNICYVLRPNLTASFTPNFGGNISCATRGPNGSIIFGGQFIDSQGNPAMLIQVESVSWKSRTLFVQTQYPYIQYVQSIWMYYDVLYCILDKAQLYNLSLDSTTGIQPSLVTQLSGLSVIGLSHGISVPILPVHKLSASEPEFPVVFLVLLAVGIPALSLIFGFVAWRLFKRKKIDATNRALYDTEYMKLREPLDAKFADNPEAKKRYLAKGAFGAVTVVRHPNGGLYASKRIDFDQKDGLKEELALKEIEILKKLHHPNVVRLQDHSLLSDHVIIYTDLFDGAVSDFYSKRIFEPEEIQVIISGLAKAISYIHSLGIAHRDIKPANLLVDLSGYDRIASVHLADFGLAITTDADGMAKCQFAGTKPFIAPELKIAFESTKDRSQMTYNAFSGDVFSFGISIWEICYGKQFGSKTDITYPVMIREDMHSLKKMIKGCKKSDPNERWTMEDVFDHIKNKV